MIKDSSLDLRKSVYYIFYYISYINILFDNFPMSSEERNIT